MTESRALDGAALRALGAYLWPSGDWRLKGRLLLVAAMAVVASALAAAAPLFMRWLVDSLAHGSLSAAAIVMIVGYPITRFAGLAIIQLRVIVNAAIMEGAKARHATTALARVLDLGRAFRLARGAGALARTLERGVLGLEWSIRSTYVVLLQVVLEALFSCAVIAGVIGAGFGLILLAVMAGYAVMAIVFTTRQVRWRKAINAHDTKASSQLVDTLLNFDVVESFGASTREVARYAVARSAQAAASVKAQASISSMNIAWRAIEAVALSAILALAARDVLAGRMTVGALVMVQVYVIQVFTNMLGLGFVYSDARQGVR
jgi:ABC-type transport system involved in Fe-S cluster assembly fused permease/ATPase subunit